MPHYPVFLDLTASDVLVVGAGAVGQRKIASLLKACPRSVTVLDPALDVPALEAMDNPGSTLICRKRAFAPEDLDGKRLVFAATDNADLNARIAKLCAERGILCNCVTAPESGTFIVPAHFSSGDLSVALSTQGHSPALAKRLREELEDWVGKRYTPLLALLGRLRPLVLALELPTRENTALFRALARSPLADYLEQNEHAKAAALLSELLPEPLLPRVGELLHGL